MIFHSINDYLDAKERFESCNAKIIDGEGVVFVKDGWVSWNEFHANNTKPAYQRQPKIQLDGTQIVGDVIPPKKQK